MTFLGSIDRFLFCLLTFSCHLLRNRRSDLSWRNLSFYDSDRSISDCRSSSDPFEWNFCQRWCHCCLHCFDCCQHRLQAPPSHWSRRLCCSSACDGLVSQEKGLSDHPSSSSVHSRRFRLSSKALGDLTERQDFGERTVAFDSSGQQDPDFVSMIMTLLTYLCIRHRMHCCLDLWVAYLH